MILIVAIVIALAWTAGFVSGRYEAVLAEFATLVVARRLAPDVAGAVWLFAAVVMAPVTAVGVFATSSLRAPAT